MNSVGRIDYSFKSLSLNRQYPIKCWELDLFPVSQTVGPKHQNVRYSGLVFFAFEQEVSIVFGNFGCAPCSVDNRLSGCWRVVPC